MSKKIRKCDYCGHNEMVNEQHDFYVRNGYCTISMW